MKLNHRIKLKILLHNICITYDVIDGSQYSV